jgi:hypothetical protein
MQIKIDITDEATADTMNQVFTLLVTRGIRFTVIPDDQPAIEIGYNAVPVGDNRVERNTPVRKAWREENKRINAEFEEAEKRYLDQWSIVHHAPCPTCQAPLGTNCVTSGGHPTKYVHVARSNSFYGITP